MLFNFVFTFQTGCIENTVVPILDDALHVLLEDTSTGHKRELRLYTAIRFRKC